jgi:hypothetical protein|tara:strand:+ start:90 stop:416 length:327 start_codon:yes stop_codon:yes gene_type:complete
MPRHGPLRTAFRGSRLGGGTGWIGYGSGQWAPGANLAAPERRGILGRLADGRLADQWGKLIGGPDDSIDELEDEILRERLSRPDNLLQFLFRNRDSAVAVGARRRNNR